MLPRASHAIYVSLIFRVVVSSATKPDISGWHDFPTVPLIPVEPTQIAITSDSLDRLTRQLDLFEGFQATYENTQDDMQYGLNIDWITDAYNQWKTNFTWRDVEADINRHPHFQANVTNDDGEIFTVHFMALFSKRHDAIPIVLFHGWPGSFLEFLDLLDVVKARYNPESSPYHVIVPSLPGFTLSSGPPIHSNWGIANSSVVMDKLLRGIGFENGYVAQGGDIGSFIARTLGLTSSSCKAVHLNFIPSIKPDSVPDPTDDPSLTPQDHEVLKRSKEFVETGQAYALEQGTRPATLAFALNSSPVSLLTWVGEKLNDWTATPLPLNLILTHVSMYYFTGTISRSFYAYRETSYSTAPETALPPFLDKPFGYSRFPFDNSGVPETWAEAQGRMVFYKAHERGGHFAAMEMPQELWDDVESFIQKALPDGISPRS